MLTFPDLAFRDLTRLVRVTVIACVLLTLLVMQAAIFKHALEHLAASANKVSILAMHASAQPDQAGQLEQGNSQSEYPSGVTCQKCLEDASHTYVLHAVIQLSHSALSYALVEAALPHNLPFLSPERANQRAPPLIA